VLRVRIPVIILHNSPAAVARPSNERRVLVLAGCLRAATQPRPAPGVPALPWGGLNITRVNQGHYLAIIIMYTTWGLYVCMYVKIWRHHSTRVIHTYIHTYTRAYDTHTQARGATPELRRVTDTTSHGFSAGGHSTQTTIGSPGLCDRPKGGGGGRGAARKF